MVCRNIKQNNKQSGNHVTGGVREVGGGACSAGSLRASLWNAALHHSWLLLLQLYVKRGLSGAGGAAHTSS